MTTLAIFINQAKERALQTAKSIQDLQDNLGFRLVTCQEPLAKWLDLPKEEGTIPKSCIVVGGDGTLLTAAKHYAPKNIPLLGVNAGQLGFLSEVEISSINEALKKLLVGKYQLDQRSMLAVAVRREGMDIANYLGLNDTVVTRGTFARIITVDIRISGHRADRYRADGVIVATPTGSTAYSLAAGGPVVDPQAEVLVVTPICPHSLQGRAMVVRDQETVELEVVHVGGEVMLTVDGQVGYPLQAGDLVTVSRSPVVTRLIRFGDQGFYDNFRSRIIAKREVDSGEI